MEDTLQTVTDSIAGTTQSAGGVNIWMIVAIVELIVIIILLLKRGSRDSMRSIKKQVKAEGNIDFANILNSSFNADSLYKKLLIACHPDRFAPDEAKMQAANDLTTRITKNRRDINALNALRQEAINKLNVKP